MLVAIAVRRAFMDMPFKMVLVYPIVSQTNMYSMMSAILAIKRALRAQDLVGMPASLARALVTYQMVSA